MYPRNHIWEVVLAAVIGLFATAAMALAGRAQVSPDPVTFPGPSSSTR